VLLLVLLMEIAAGLPLLPLVPLLLMVAGYASCRCRCRCRCRRARRCVAVGHAGRSTMLPLGRLVQQLAEGGRVAGHCLLQQRLLHLPLRLLVGRQLGAACCWRHALDMAVASPTLHSRRWGHPREPAGLGLRRAGAIITRGGWLALGGPQDAVGRQQRASRRLSAPGGR
jgi:hypothetical protein